MQAAVSVNCQSPELMKIETHASIVARRCFVTAGGLVLILPWNLFTSISQARQLSQ